MKYYCNFCENTMVKINSGWTEKGEFETYECPHCKSIRRVELGFKRDRKDT